MRSEWRLDPWIILFLNVIPDCIVNILTRGSATRGARARDGRAIPPRQMRTVLSATAKTSHRSGGTSSQLSFKQTDPVTLNTLKCSRHVKWRDFFQVGLSPIQPASWLERGGGWWWWWIISLAGSCFLRESSLGRHEIISKMEPERRAVLFNLKH